MLKNVFKTFADAYVAAARNMVLAAGGPAIIDLRPTPEKRFP
jgi:hypothetical protein